MAGSSRRVRVVFEAEIQGFKAAMAEAAAATQRTKKASEDAGKAADTHLGRLVQSASKNRDAWEQSGGAMAGFGAAALAGVGLAVKSFAEFDKQISAVQAATHATGGEMSQLRDLAVSAGADTSFSAKEAAQGIEELSKAGVSTKDVLGGGLAGALSLAAAGSLSVGEAAETAASAMTQFKLSGQEIPHIADLLAAGAGKAQGSVHDMGAALNQVGLVAAQTGLTIEETTGGLAAFASAGLTGSDAGTSFKTMLGALTPNSAAAATAMDELGISAYDSQGKFVGLSEFAGQLKTSLSGLTAEQRNSTLETIFGSDAVRAAAVLYEQGAEGVQKWEDAVNDAGYAAVTAATMQDNLAGDIEKLGGSLDSVFLKSASGANGALRGLVQGAEDLVDSIGKIPGPLLETGLGLAGIVGAGALAGGAFLTLFPKVMETHAAFKTLAADSPKLAGALGKIGKGAGLAAVAMAGLQVASAFATEKHTKSAEEFGQALLKVGKASKDIDSSGLDSAFQGWDKTFGEEKVRNVNGMSDAVKELFNHSGYEDFAKSFDGFNQLIGAGISPLGELENRFKGLGDAMGDLVKNGGADTAATSFKSLTAEFEKNGKSAKDALDVMPGYRDALLAQATSAGVALNDQELLDLAMGKVPASMENAAGATKTFTDATGASKPVTEEMAKALEEVGLSASGTVTDLVKFTEALLNAGLLQLSARDAARGWSQALIDMGLQADGTGGKVGVLGTAFDNTTAQGIKNQEMFDGVAQAGIRNAEALAANGASQKDLQGNLTTTYNGLIAAAGQFGITGDEAVALTRKVLGVPPGVSIQSWMSSEAKRMAEATGAAADAVNGKTVNVYVNTHETTFQRVVRELSGDTSAPVGKGTVLRAAGGRIPGYAFGGQLPTSGPGTEVTDGFLGVSSLGMPMARVDAGEWIIRRESSDRYNRELAAINAGTFPKLPGYANGGREYTAQSLGHGSYRATPVSSVTYQIDAKPGLAYEYAKDIAHQTATRTRDINAAYGI